MTAGVMSSTDAVLAPDAAHSSTRQFVSRRLAWGSSGWGTSGCRSCGPFVGPAIGHSASTSIRPRCSGCWPGRAISRHSVRVDRVVAGGRTVPAHRGHAADVRSGCHLDLRSHAVDRTAATPTCPTWRTRLAKIAKHLRPGQLVVLESTTYPGTTRDVVLPILAESGLRVGQDFFLAYSPEREDPGNPQLHGQQHSESRGRDRTAELRPGRGAVLGGRGPDRARVELRGGGSLQDPREHLSLRQHRPGQRAEGPVRPHGDRRLGGDRGRQDEALRIPGVLSGARAGRPLHPHRPLLFDLAGAEARAAHAVHRTGGGNQLQHAPPRRRPGGRSPERRRPALAGQPHCHPGRGVQDGTWTIRGRARRSS